MSATTPARLTARNVQLLRALFSGVAAVMITFSPDHSAQIGLSVFSGWAAVTALLLVLSAWLATEKGRRGRVVLLAVVYFAAGMAAGFPGLRGTVLLFVVFIAWGVLAGVVELVTGVVDRRAGRDRVLARDAIVTGAITLLFAAAVSIVPPAYSLDYFIEEAGQSFTLTGTIIAVGLFGGYAAIVTVYLGIAGLSPRPAEERAGDPAPDAGPPGAPEPAMDDTHEKDPA